jgi:hypothetical protein
MVLSCSTASQSSVAAWYYVVAASVMLAAEIMAHESDIVTRSARISTPLESRVDELTTYHKKCTFSGHVMTDRDWFGYIANLSFMTPQHDLTKPKTTSVQGRITFDFRFPADLCCPTVTFYTAHQASAISIAGQTRLSCWQRENIARPEDDQILRLTPRFVWSGCQLVDNSNGKLPPEYVCNGGRSFVVDGYGGNAASQSWYVAVSNCDKANGLADFRYCLNVYGQQHSTCQQPPHLPPVNAADYTPVEREMSPPSVRHLGSASDEFRKVSTVTLVCTLDGSFTATAGFRQGPIVIGGDAALAPGSGINFRLHYDYTKDAGCIPTLMLFDDNKRDGLFLVSHSDILSSCRREFGELVAQRRPNQPECHETGIVNRTTVTCVGHQWYRSSSNVRLIAVVCNYCRDEVLVNYRIKIFEAANENELTVSTAVNFKTAGHSMVTLLCVVILLVY